MNNNVVTVKTAKFINRIIANYLYGNDNVLSFFNSRSL